MKRKLLLRFLLTLFTIFCCTTIAGAAVQEMHTRAVFEKACVLEGETSFSAEFVAAKTTPSAFARSQQGSGAYPGVDRWRDIIHNAKRNW